MSYREEKVSMPMTSAGIVGFAPDIKISGTEIEPKLLVGGAILFVLVVKAASLAIGY